MRKNLSLLFTLLYFMAMVKPVMPVLEYLYNQDYIAEVLCINKDKPMLNCDGKCYLAKMIKEQQKEKQHQDVPSVDLREYPIGFVDILEYGFVTNINSKKTIISWKNLYQGKHNASIFHPPNTIV
ncbi:MULTISPECIES: hypothetical protein [Maribacter]|uniref:WG repeat-containing protein n=1 Tax=Maribacter flavus TaxID=1658664 RepID=A0ABU7IFR3_9FLAO|nr:MULTISPECIES: hypothetical protein [Maribacter]MDC6404319.1 hypothetical protein [Maribacter sp. PR66]MEE1971461.1 hypothetical protein [Maribacter flavus]